MKQLFLFILISFNSLLLKAQVYYSDKNAEGYILNAALFNSRDYLNPNIKDIQCFELHLSKKIAGYYSDFYRQYSTKLINGRKSLIIDIFRKTYFKNKSELKKPFSVIDGCEDVRHIIFDIRNEEIIYNENGGGCD